MEEIRKKFSLENKVAIVTGASRGIGQEIAVLFSKAGAKVVIASRKFQDLQIVADEINNQGGKAVAIPCHAGKYEDIKNLVSKTVEVFGKVDILVNNAAANPVFGWAQDVDEAAWDKIFEVNLKGYFLLIKEVVKIMVKQNSGCIINISSTAGIKPIPFLGVYSISKAGVIHLTKVFAQELAQYNIRVNCIAPGVVKTKFSRALWENEDIYQEVIKQTPMKRIAMPDEIAPTALFLASEAASYITGEVIVVSGGG